MFATACSPANAAAALAALRVLREEPERVARLRDRAPAVPETGPDCGLDTGNSHDTPIVPIILGNSARCIHVSQELLRRGVNAQPILYPAVRESAARVRFFITAEHTEEQIIRTVECSPNASRRRRAVRAEAPDLTNQPIKEAQSDRIKDQSKGSGLFCPSEKKVAPL